MGTLGRIPVETRIAPKRENWQLSPHRRGVGELCAWSQRVFCTDCGRPRRPLRKRLRFDFRAWQRSVTAARRRHAFQSYHRSPLPCACHETAVVGTVPRTYPKTTKQDSRRTPRGSDVVYTVQGPGAGVYAVPHTQLPSGSASQTMSQTRTRTAMCEQASRARAPWELTGSVQLRVSNATVQLCTHC